MAAHGFAAGTTPRDLVDAALLLANYAPPAPWRRALRVTASAEDLLRKIGAPSGDFDLGQIVAHVYLGIALGGGAGFAAYQMTPGHGLLFRESALVATFLLVTVTVAIVVHKIWKAAVSRAHAPASVEEAVPLALQVATAASDRSGVAKELTGARIVRKRLAATVASSAGP